MAKEFKFEYANGNFETPDANMVIDVFQEVTRQAERRIEGIKHRSWDSLGPYGKDDVEADKKRRIKAIEESLEHIYKARNEYLKAVSGKLWDRISCQHPYLSLSKTENGYICICDEKLPEKKVAKS